MKTKRRAKVARRVSQPSSPVAAAPAAATPAANSTSLVTRANNYLDLETQIAAFIASVPQRRADEQAKLVSELAAATSRTPASVATRFATYDTAVKQLDQQAGGLRALLSVIESATNDFARANLDTIKTALAQRRDTLAQERSKDEQDRAALARQIKAIDERLRRFESLGAKS